MMENNQYPATGGLFVQKEKRSENSPDYSGMLSLEIEVVNDLIKQKQEGISQPSINVVGWKKLSKAGNPYLRIIGNIERDRQEGGNQKPKQEYQNKKSNDVLDDEIPF